MSSKILEIEHVCKTYKIQNEVLGNHRPVLTDISFSLEKGESVGIIGRNGSGKSTLLKIISGIVKPTTGKVKHYGSFSSILDLGFGIISELSGRDNIYFIGKIAGLTYQTIKKNEEEIIDFSGLEQFIDEPVKNYSSGMYLRLAFSIQAALKPDLLILDEIVNAGDYDFQLKCLKRIRGLKSNGCSIVLVSHNLPEIENSCENTIWLEEGKVRSVGKTMDIINSYLNSEKTKNRERSEFDFSGNLNDSIACVRVEPSRIKIFKKDGFNIKISFDVLLVESFYVTFFLSDFKGLVWADSALFDKNSTLQIDKCGKYDISINFPKDMLNQGYYNIGFIIASEDKHYYESYNCAELEVEYDIWEKEKHWVKKMEYYPIRMPLQWEKN